MKKLKNQYAEKAMRCGALALTVVLTWQVVVPSVTHVISAVAEEDGRLSKIYGILSETVGEPETAQDYYEIANISIGKGEYETALQQLETARRLLLTDEAAESAKQTEVGCENAEEKTAEKDMGSLADEERALLANIELKIASVYILTDQLSEAQTALDDAIETDPNAEQALILRAQLNIEQQDYVEAIADMEKYMELNPMDTANRQTLAQLLESVSDYEGAMVQYRTLYELAPEDEAFNLNALRCLFLCGRYEEAVAGFDDYKLRTAETGDAFGGIVDFLRAACLMQIGDYAAATEGFEMAIDAGYERSYCLEQMTLCCFESGEYEKVMSVGNELFAMQAASVSAPELVYQRMGISAMRLGDYESALTNLDHAAELDAALEGNDYYRGVSLLSLQRSGEAVEAFTASIEQNYLPQFCYYNRGVCYVDLLEYDKAIDDMAMTLEAGEDEELIAAAKDILWQFADYFDQLNAAEAVGQNAGADAPVVTIEETADEITEKTEVK